ncbi:MAG: Pycsar system effector family protein [Bacteroidota bacterium]
MESTNQPRIEMSQIAAYVERFIKDNVADTYVFHNFQHTLAVVHATQELLQHFDISESDRRVVKMAAWFHDLGYNEGWEGHEQRSATIAKAYLEENELASAEEIDRICSCILATKMPQAPINLLQRILCDADLSHLGDNSYWDRCGRVRQEFTLTRETIMSDQEWIDFELNFMLQHDYQTEAARELYGERKEAHIKQLLKRKKALLPDQTPADLGQMIEENKKKTKKKKKKRDKAAVEAQMNKLSRGVETMYRASYRTHVNLSSIADNKANIMLSVNAIVLSITAANLIPRLDSNPHLTVPTVILVMVLLLSLFFAIQATRPKVTEGKSSMESIKNRTSNLLFFGNFYNMKLEDFHFGMMEMIKDDEFLYSSMTRDLYYLGVVLAKKYRFLRLTYNIFLFGMIMAVLAFIIAAVVKNLQAVSEGVSMVVG